MENLYAPFITHPEQLRAFNSTLRETNAFISGSKVAEFLDRSSYPAGDLDVFVTSNHALKIHSTLVVFGYKIVATSKASRPLKPCGPTFISDYDSHAQYPITGIDAVLTYMSPIRGLEIQLICCTNHPLEVIFAFGASMCSFGETSLLLMIRSSCLKLCHRIYSLFYVPQSNIPKSQIASYSNPRRET